MYFKEGVKRARVQYESGAGKFSRASYSKFVMRKHGDWWMHMEQERKQYFHYLAEEERMKQVLVLGDAMHAELVSLRALEEQIADESSRKGLASLASCRFQSSDFESVFSHLQAIREHKARTRLRRIAASCPEPLSKKDFHEVQQMGLQRLRAFQVSSLPQWSKLFARNRELFTDAILHVCSPGKALVSYKFVYAVESPLLVYWLELQEDEVTATGLADASMSIDQITLLPNALFTVASWAATESHEIVVDDAVLCVSMYCTWWSHQRIAVYGSVQSIDDIAAELTESQSMPAHPPAPVLAKEPSTSSQDKVVQQFPWMRGILAEASNPSATSAAAPCVPHPEALSVVVSASESSNAAIEHGETEHMSDDIQSMFRELGEEQTTFKNNTVVDSSCFTISLLGEARKMKHTGDAVAGVKASIRPGTDCETWARAFNLQQGSRFEVSKYSQVYATKLARSWVHRMSFLYSLYWNGSKDKPYDDESLA
eukprot:6484100-Amphidinium_carterae.1